MEKATRLFRLLAAIFIATSAGMRLVQNIRETLAAAEAEISAEDARVQTGIDKLTRVMEDAARKAQN
jgi:hypothetical protein